MFVVPLRAGLSVAIVVCLALACYAQSPDDQYVLGPDSQRQEGVPRGKVTEYVWKSDVF
jgi:hypothetical protein